MTLRGLFQLGLAWCCQWNEAEMGGDADFSGLVRRGVVPPTLSMGAASLPASREGPHAVL